MTEIKPDLLFFNIVSLYFNTLFNWYINLTIDGTIYPSQHFPFGAAFVMSGRKLLDPATYKAFPIAKESQHQMAQECWQKKFIVAYLKMRHFERGDKVYDKVQVGSSPSRVPNHYLRSKLSDMLDVKNQ